MPDRAIDIPPEQLVAWVKRDAAEGGYDYHLTVAREFEDSEGPAPVARGTLTIEPPITHNRWILTVEVRKPAAAVADDPYAPPGESLYLRLDDFEREFLPVAPGQARVVASLDTPEAAQHFDDWLAGLRARLGV